MPCVTSFSAKTKPEHAIHIVRGSLMHKLLETEEATVNTTHHQAVEKLAPGFTITARAADGIAEAIERGGEPLVFGVQFHPERLRLQDKRFDTLFKHFVARAREARAKPGPLAENQTSPGKEDF